LPLTLFNHFVGLNTADLFAVDITISGQLSSMLAC